MGRRKGSKNKKNTSTSSKKGLKAIKTLRGNGGGGGYLVRIYGDTATLRGSVEGNKNGLVSIKHKRPGLGVVRTIVAEENIVSERAGSIVVRGVPVEEFFATAVVRKDGITYAKTLDEEKVTLPTINFEITQVVEEEAEEEEEVEAEAEASEDDEEEEAPKKKKKSSDDDEEEEEEEKPKKKKKKDDEEDEGDSDADWGI